MAHWAEVTTQVAEGSGGDYDQTLLRTTGQRAALSCWGETCGVEKKESGGCHTGSGKTRYLSGSTERVQEEKLKRQQNRNRKSEEGLQSGGEGKQRGLGMAPHPPATGPDAQPLLSTCCLRDRWGG